MARTPLDAFVTEKALHQIAIRQNDDIVDMVENGQLDGNIPLKNVCAKVNIQLAEQIDEVVSLLGCNKRQFLETAFRDAVLRAHAIMDYEGFWDSLEDHPTATKIEVAQEPQQ